MTERLMMAAADGRVLDVELSGPADGVALLFHTGTPMAGMLFAPMVDAGAERGVRHIAYSRPGYGDSERRQGRSVADCVSDVTTIADALGIERFLTVGWSGGGPHALACAALAPQRTIAAATIAGAAPRDAEGLDWLAGMSEENLEEFSAADAGEQQLLAYLNDHGAGYAEVTGAELHAALGELLSPVDTAVLTGDFADYMAAAARGAVKRGMWGWLDDDIAFSRDWGFALEQITRPVTIWQGGQDRFVPFAHGQWLAAHVAGAQPQLLPEEGHLSLSVGAYGRVLDDLLAAG
jgi:pimeloyl-ACP methyl ester carboxylesterase